MQFTDNFTMPQNHDMVDIHIRQVNQAMVKAIKQFLAHTLLLRSGTGKFSRLGTRDKSQCGKQYDSNAVSCHFTVNGTVAGFELG